MSKLVEDQIVKHYRSHHVSELLGAFDFTDSKFQPSFSQIRQNLTEYAILPLGSSFLRENLPESSMLPKSILLYGPEGSGKTMLAQAVATQTHALFLDLSPRNLQGKFESSKGPTALMHMVFKIAKDVNMAPVVIYIDDVEHLFVNSKKSDSAGRFKKDLITYKKWLDERKDRVIIIGNLGDPSKLNDASKKEIKAFFDRALYVRVLRVVFESGV